MHDIKAIRENPAAYDKLWAKRGLPEKGQPQLSKKIIDQDALIRKAMQVVQEAEAARNKSSKLIGQAMAKGDKEEAERLKTEVAGAKNVIAAMGTQVDSEKAQLQELLAGLPNVPFEDVPEGEDEASNVEMHKHLEPTRLGFEPKGHDELGEALGMMDFETAAKMSGSRFVVLSGMLSRLDRALAAFMLDLQTEEHGYTETTPPFLVWEKALYGTGQLPKFEEDLYKASAPTRIKKMARSFDRRDILEEMTKEALIDSIMLPQEVSLPFLDNHQHYLIPTAEVSLTNIVRESIVDLDKLPIRMTAHTPCFRSEAGSAGRDTTGMIRQHQFNKVELVSITRPEDSESLSL